MNRIRKIELYSTDSTNQLEIQKRLLLAHFNTIEADLRFLPQLNELLRYRELENEEDRQLIEQEFLEFIKSSKMYDQLRYIDKNGIEVIRVDYNYGDPSITPRSELQNKADRYYFQESIKLPSGSTYISPFDLNVEHGMIQEPYKPMIRFGTPIFNKRNETRGIVILNFLGKILLDDLAEATRTYPGIYSLLNTNGYWLYDNNPDIEWAFMFPDKEDMSLALEKPELWRQLSSGETAQIMIDETLYTAASVKILPETPADVCTDCFVLLNRITTREMKVDKRRNRIILLNVTIASALVFSLLSLILARTIRQRNEYRAALQESALYDQLTGLPNRILLHERGIVAAAEAQRYNHSYAVMFIDLDSFKPVNDHFGHAAGDAVLAEVGLILSTSIRKADTAARFGGDEFIILLSRINDIEDCKSIAEKILTRLAESFNIDGRSIRIGASIGIAAVQPGINSDFDKIMQSADAVMYEVKNSGKNNYKIVRI